MTVLDCECPHCLAVLAVPRHYAGRRVTCENCQEGLIVPGGKADEEISLTVPDRKGGEEEMTAAQQELLLELFDEMGPMAPPDLTWGKWQASRVISQILEVKKERKRITGRLVDPASLGGPGNVGERDRSLIEAFAGLVACVVMFFFLVKSCSG